jgi:hypothetical protein
MSTINLKHTIITEAIPFIEAELKKLERKALKLGVPGFTMTVTEPRFVERDDMVQEVVDITITGEPITLNGWTYMGRIVETNDENLIFTDKGVPAPEAYRKTDPKQCEHCGYKRNRLFTALIQHQDGSYKQVGSGCIDAFLTVTNADSAIQWWMNSVTGLVSMLEAQSKVKPTTHTGGYRPGVIGVNGFQVLTLACAYARRHGYTQNTYQDDIIDIQNELWNNQIRTEVLAGDIAQALRIVTWVNEQPDDQGYFRNLGITLVPDNIVPIYLSKFICSALFSYNRAMQAAPAVAVTQPDVFYGQVGQRITIDVKIVKIVMIADHYNGGEKPMFIMRKPGQPSTFIWFKSCTNNHSYPLDKMVKITGTIKEHETYKGRKQTILTRCAFN